MPEARVRVRVRVRVRESRARAATLLPAKPAQRRYKGDTKEIQRRYTGDTKEMRSEKRCGVKGYAGDELKP